MKFKNIVYYLLGLFIITVGIAFSIKSNLGISPISSIPYTMTVVWGVEIGFATFIFHCMLVLIQFILLRRDFKLKNFAQIFVGIIFGYFTSFSVGLMNFIPDSTNIFISIGYMTISIFVIAFGIFLYLPANLLPVAGEGVMQSFAVVFHMEFSKVKIGFDIVMVAISAIVCLISIHSFGSVGLGTILSSVFVGIALDLIVSVYVGLTGRKVDLKNEFG